MTTYTEGFPCAEDDIAENVAPTLNTTESQEKQRGQHVIPVHPSPSNDSMILTESAESTDLGDHMEEEVTVHPLC